MNATGPTTDPRWELLDAYADGELDPNERRAVEDLLRDSPEARTELAEVERVRALVRGLPAVDPPFGLYERLRSRRTRRSRAGVGAAVAALGAVAAAIVLILAVTPVADPVAPPVDDLAARHVMLASSAGEMPEGYEPMPTDEPAAAPAAPAGFTELAAYRAPDGVHLVYGRDGSRVSVFEQEGELDWDELPPDGDRMAIDGAEAWITDRASGARAAEATLTVVALDGAVVTVVGDVEPTGARQLAEAMPRPADPGMVDRAGDACSWVAESFGFPE